MEGAERPRLKIKGTPIHYLLARRATAQLESQRMWRSKGKLYARSVRPNATNRREIDGNSSRDR
jgi:hypothetical protein